MGSTITRRSSEHKLATGASGLLDAKGVPARDAVRLLDWQPENTSQTISGRPPSALPPAPRGLLDLDRAFIRVTGPERESWIQGVQTADVRGIPANGAAPTLFLNARGRTVSPAMLWRFPDALIVAVPKPEAEMLFAHLDRLLIMEDATLALATDLRELRLSPGGAQELLAALPADRKEAFADLHGAETPLGLELLVPAEIGADDAEPAAEELLAAIPNRPDANAIEAYRIALGVPAWRVDFDSESTPLEAGLDSCIAFDKGCYVGQEVIAMATYRGRVPWNLVRLELEGEPPTIGEPLDVPRGGKGKVTSATAVGSRAILIGLVHREKAEPGAQVALTDGRIATVLGLPLGSQLRRA